MALLILFSERNFQGIPAVYTESSIAKNPAFSAQAVDGDWLLWTNDGKSAPIESGFSVADIANLGIPDNSISSVQLVVN